MKLRGATKYGGVSYYRLIGSVHAGEPVMPGDTYGSDNFKRDRALTRYAGPQHRTITAAQFKEMHDQARQDPTPDAQQPTAEPGGYPEGS